MAITRALIPHLPAIHVARPGTVARRFVIGFLFGVLLVLGGLIGFRQAYADKILPGVVVGGVNIGSLTPAQAREALAARFGPLENGSVVIHTSRGDRQIPYARLGRTFDLDTMVGSAFAIGRSGTPFDEAMAGLRQLETPVSLEPLVGFDRARLTDELAGFASGLSIAPLDAKVTSSAAGFAVWQSVDGVRLDTGSVAPQIEAALLDPATSAEIAVSADIVGVAPRISDERALKARDLATRIASDLTLTNGSKSWKIPAAQIRTWISFAETDEGYRPSIDPTKVPTAFGGVSKAVAVKAREATYLRDRSGRIFGVSGSGSGRALDVATTARAVVGALEGRARGASPATATTVVVAAVGPKLNTSEAVKTAPLMVKLGSWTTYYQVAPHNGMSANITTPARKLNGIVLKPGQVFEYWSSIGEVSFRTGYRLGGAIIGGRSVEGKTLGGGMCATSTTLFNAAANAGLEILARKPHWYYIKRYPVGLDATVSQSQTMKFRNDTRYPVLIKSIASPGVVRFEIWSVPNGRTVTWTKPSISNVVRGYDTVKKSAALPRGRKLRIEWPVNGMDVSVTRTVREANGRIAHHDTFISHYHRMVGITLVGS
jgi:vancomycin resistance protein YoaR